MQTRSKTKGRIGEPGEGTNKVPPETAKIQPSDGSHPQQVEPTAPPRKKTVRFSEPEPQPPSTQDQARPRGTARRSEPKPFVLDESILKLNPYSYLDMLELMSIVGRNGWDWTDFQRPYFYEHWHIPINLEAPLEERKILAKRKIGTKFERCELVVRWPRSVVFTYNCGRFALGGVLRLNREGDRMSEKEVRDHAEKCLAQAAAAGFTRENRDEIQLLIGFGAENMWDCITEAAKRGHNDTIKDLYESFEEFLGKGHRIFYPENVNWDCLFYAAEWGQNETIDFLDSFFGMSPNADSMDVAECAFICSSREPVQKLIHFAAGKDHVHTVRHLIEVYDYSPNECLRFGETVLDVARESGAKRVIEYLQENGGVEEWMTWDTDSSMYNLSDSDGISVISDDALETMDQRARKHMTEMIEGTSKLCSFKPPMWHQMGGILITLFGPRRDGEHIHTVQDGRIDPAEGVGSNYDPKPLTPSRLKRVWHKLGGRFKISSEDYRRKHRLYNDGCTIS